MIEQGTYKILRHPDDRLREVAASVDSVGDEERDMAARMLATMRQAEGIGLAATQVGIGKRIIVADVSGGEKEPLLLANPVVEESSREKNTHEEGCLSVPGVTASVTRPAQVRVSALDIGNGGERIEIEADELLATCLQHEVDHLDGILFFDRVSRLSRSRVLRQYRKALQEAKEQG